MYVYIIYIIYIYIVNSERSKPLVCSMARIFIIYISDHSRSKIFLFVSKYIDISFLRNANIKRATCKCNRLNEFQQYKTDSFAQCLAFHSILENTYTHIHIHTYIHAYYIHVYNIHV